MEQLHRTALQNGIPALYHYEKFNATYLITTLRDQIIHCSDPASLNDPWDCKPAFDPHALDNPEVLEREMAWRIPHPAKHLWEEQMRTDPTARVDFMLGASKSIEAMLAQRRIYCLTPKPDNNLMWSHYADNHRGICLEFSVPDNPLFSKAAEVVYREEYPHWVPCDIKDRPGLVMELILTKSADWCYEKRIPACQRSNECLVQLSSTAWRFFPSAERCYEIRNHGMPIRSQEHQWTHPGTCTRACNQEGDPLPQSLHPRNR